MELYQIRQFVAVAETGSFTKGAARASVSQPAVSAAVAKLEQETREGGFLSVAEMIRAKHGLTPWPNGTTPPKRATSKKVAARASMR